MNYFKSDSLRNHTTIIHKHTDAEGNTVAEQINNEIKQIVDRTVLLEQMPHRGIGMEVILEKKNIISGLVEQSRLVEIDNRDDITSKSQYKIDYNTGKIHVHYDLEGFYLKVNYWGIGNVLLHASRVYTQLDANGSIVTTLEELIKDIKTMTDVTEMLNILRQIEEANTSTILGVSFENIKARLENIETDLRKNRSDNVIIGNEVVDIKSNMTGVINTVKDVEDRMDTLENNYLNPNIITNAEIDEILKGLV